MKPFSKPTMPAPRFRSRTFRRVKKKLPGGKNVIHYEKRKTSLPHCAVCKAELKGIPELTPQKMKKLGVSKKRPQRVYGGYLCSKCSRQAIKQEARE
jgi:large subunit ribosomal protein L34e